MTPEEAAKILVEECDVTTAAADAKPDTLKAFADRLLLRIFDNTSLLSFLYKAAVDKNKSAVELDFYRLPDEVIPDVYSLAGVDRKDVDMYLFNVSGRPHHGFRIRYVPSEWRA